MRAAYKKMAYCCCYPYKFLIEGSVHTNLFIDDDDIKLPFTHHFKVGRHQLLSLLTAFNTIYGAPIFNHSLAFYQFLMIVTMQSDKELLRQLNSNSFDIQNIPGLFFD